MLLPFLVFVVVAGLDHRRLLRRDAAAGRARGAAARSAAARRVDADAERRSDGDRRRDRREARARRAAAGDRSAGGAAPAPGSRLARLIEQSGVRTTPSAIGADQPRSRRPARGLIDVPVRPAAVRAARRRRCSAAFVPFALAAAQRSARLKKFEEQFPEALDLLSRAIRAGHAFQTALGMVADELPEPVGPEFKKTFDQQNFGLPLRDALNELAERIGILDVRFFVTAVLIQRDTGGNLSEILDNLAHVVRERFKIRRQVRVHTAHGRFTGYVLLALPAALGDRAVVHQPRAHAAAVSRAHGPDDADGRDRHADHRLRLDPPGHQDRGVGRDDAASAPRVSVRLAADRRRARWRSRPAPAATIERRLGEVTGDARQGVDRRPRLRPGDDRRAQEDSARWRRGRASEMGKLQQRLVTAGYRSHEAIVVFFGIRLGCALRRLRAAGDADRRAAEPGRWRSSAARSATCCRAWCSARMAKRRQHRIRLGLPDALDLLVVSVEAGLGLDQAIQRVGDELASRIPDLSRRAAADQPRAARRQGARRGAAQSRRAHRRRRHRRRSSRCWCRPTSSARASRSRCACTPRRVRTKRRQRAEEAAAKTGVKMVFPLVFCIFPAIWVVTIGPAVIKFIQVLVPMAQQMSARSHSPPLAELPNTAPAPPVPTTLAGHRPERRPGRAAADQDALRRRGDRPGARRPHAPAVRDARAAHRARARRAAGRSARRDRLRRGRLSLRADRRGPRSRAAVSRRQPVRRPGAGAARGLRRARCARCAAARGYIDRERLRQGFSHLIISDHVLEQLGPAVNAGKAVFLYGPPGNGKTVIAEGLGRALGGDMYMPHAIDVDGHIITMFDPINHESLEADAEASSVIADRAARSPLGAHPPAGRDGRRRAHARHARPDASTRSRSSTRRRFS